MKTNKRIITINGDLWAKFKAECALKGITMKEGLTTLLEKEVQK